MALGTYQIGQLMRLDALFELLNPETGEYEPGNPTSVSVKVKVKDPDGVWGEEFEFTTLTTPAIQAGEDDGQYYLELPIEAEESEDAPGGPGEWHYKWFGVGAVVAADEPMFKVRSSNFAA